MFLVSCHAQLLVLEGFVLLIADGLTTESSDDDATGQEEKEAENDCSSCSDDDSSLDNGQAGSTEAESYAEDDDGSDDETLSDVNGEDVQGPGSSSRSSSHHQQLHGSAGEAATAAAVVTILPREARLSPQDSNVQVKHTGPGLQCYSNVVRPINLRMYSNSSNGVHKLPVQGQLQLSQLAQMQEPANPYPCSEASQHAWPALRHNGTRNNKSLLASGSTRAAGACCLCLWTPGVMTAMLAGSSTCLVHLVQPAKPCYLFGQCSLYGLPVLHTVELVMAPFACWPCAFATPAGAQQ